LLRLCQEPEKNSLSSLFFACHNLFALGKKKMTEKTLQIRFLFSEEKTKRKRKIRRGKKKQGMRERLKRITSLHHLEGPSGAVKIFDPQDFLSAKSPRRYSEAERRKMMRYESVTTYESQTTVYKDHLERRSREPRWFIWGFVVLIGSLTAMTAVVMVSSLHVLYAVKMRLLDFGLQGFSFSESKNDPLSNDDQYASVARVFEGQDTHLWGMPNKNYWAGFVMWTSFALVMSLGSSLISALVPESIGAGSAEVMAYLNGVDNVALADMRVFLAKILSTLFIIASGACVGHYGPLIQLGTMIATLLLGRSRLVRFDNIHLTQAFRNPRDRRIITVIGAAAGVASAFSVSIGGLMVVMEQLATVLPVRFALYVFVTGLVSTLTLQTYFSYMSYFQVRPRDGFFSGQLLSDVLIQFDTKNALFLATVPMNILDFLPAAVLGLVCGLLAVLFLRISAIGLKFRRYVERKYDFPSFRLVQPVFVNTLYMALVYWIAVATTSSSDACQLLPEEILANRNRSVVSYYGLTGSLCDPYLINTTVPGSPNVTYSVPPIIHTFSSLSFGFPDSSLQLLFSWNTPTAIPAWILVTFGCTYFLFSAYSSSTTLSGDIMLPSMMIGGVVGRLVGIVFYQVTKACTSNPADYKWADPGTFALFGAGCFLAATTGLTFSICVILMEITDDFRHILPVMLGISIAKKICARFAHDFSTAYLEARCVPLLDFADEVYKYDMFSAKHVMNRNVVKVGTVLSIAEVVDLLESCKHNGFPVESLRDGTFKGTILRSEIEALLWHIYFTNNTQVCSYEFRQRVENRMFHEKCQGVPSFHASWLDERLDLSPYIDQSCFSIPETTSLSRTYTLFRTLGIRHLVVVNKDNRIVGMITRKDLVSDNIVERIIRVNEARKARARSGQSVSHVDTGDMGYPESSRDGGTSSNHIDSLRSKDSLTSKLLRLSSVIAPGPPGKHLRDEDWIVVGDDDEDEVEEEYLVVDSSGDVRQAARLSQTTPRLRTSSGNAQPGGAREDLQRILKRSSVPEASDDDDADVRGSYQAPIVPQPAEAADCSSKQRPEPTRVAKVAVTTPTVEIAKPTASNASFGERTSAVGKSAAALEIQRMAVQQQLAARQRSASHFSDDAAAPADSAPRSDAAAAGLDDDVQSDDSVDLLREAQLGPTAGPGLYSPAASPVGERRHLGEEHLYSPVTSEALESHASAPIPLVREGVRGEGVPELAHRDGRPHSVQTSEESMVTVAEPKDEDLAANGAHDLTGLSAA
jgi:chloride channel 7